ncbi:MAG: hypothetical protein AAGJ18_14470 [Bacteroidota bacterium]
MMNSKMKVLLAALLITSVFTREKICQHLGFGEAKIHGSSIAIANETESPQKQPAETCNYFVNDTLYYWNEQLLDWSPIDVVPPFKPQLVAYNDTEKPITEPIELTWQLLMDIQYRLRYFSELDTEIYASVFPEAIRALEGKEVIIEGFVIPFDEEGELLALSHNPYAACFFCGKASPASVMSIYLENKDNTYKADDFKKFRGRLRLNSDDPNEFYYILEGVKVERS